MFRYVIQGRSIDGAVWLCTLGPGDLLNWTSGPGYALALNAQTAEAVLLYVLERVQGRRPDDAIGHLQVRETTQAYLDQRRQAEDAAQEQWQQAEDEERA